MVSLDIVRGIAAAMVLLTHLGNPFSAGSLPDVVVSAYHQFFRTFIWCNGGTHAAVVVFIVLSGFCIHMPLAAEVRTPTRDYWCYYARKRFFRIYPVLLFAVLLGLVSHLAMNGWKSVDVVNSVVSLTGLPALVPIGGPTGNGILLTVIVECVLYLAYPLIVTCKNRAGWGAVIGVASLLYLVNMVAFVLFGGEAVWFHCNFFAFLLYWTIGALAVEFAAGIVTYRRRISGIVVLVSYLVYFVCCHQVQFKGSHYFKSVILALVTAHLLCFLHQRERSKPFRSGLAQGLSLLGERSYSLYVTHLPVLTVVAFLLPQKTSIGQEAFGYALALVLAAGVTTVSYHFVEAPCHRYAKSLSLRDRTMAAGDLQGTFGAEGTTSSL